MQQWYHIGDIEKPDSPALLVFPERVKKNIQSAVELTGGSDRLRPHVKTHKSAEVTRMQLQQGIRKFKCATIAEAEMLGQCGADDVLLAYQPVGPKLERFIRLIRKYPATIFSCLTDHPDAALSQSRVFERESLQVPVYVDINAGMNRTGIVPGEEAYGLYSTCAAAKGILIRGLHVYDGHIRDVDFQMRTEHCNRSFEPVEQLMHRLIAGGLPTPEIIAGGSPTFPIHAKRKTVECSPGTFVYWDQGYLSLCPEQPFEIAAVLLTRVVSLPTPNRICLDLGHKSVAAENEIARRVYFPEAPELIPVGQSEEHLVVELPDGHSYKPGDLLYGIPFHICPTVALYERVFTVEEGRITGEWENTARDKSIGI